MTLKKLDGWSWISLNNQVKPMFEKVTREQLVGETFLKIKWNSYAWRIALVYSCTENLLKFQLRRLLLKSHSAEKMLLDSPSLSKVLRTWFFKISFLARYLLKLILPCLKTIFRQRSQQIILSKRKLKAF